MNFDFLKNNSFFKQLYAFCADAEEFVLSRSELSAISQRKALECGVKYFYTAKYGEYNERETLFSLIADEQFSAYMDTTIFSGIHLVRQIGNNAAHGESVSKTEALNGLEALYYFCAELLKCFGVIRGYEKFDKTIYTKKAEPTTETVRTLDEATVEVTKADVAELKLDKIEKAAFRSAADFTEAKTRSVYIDNALREAGWKVSKAKGAIIPNTACIEIPLDGMPNNEGIGYADYVLFDSDGKPLAVVEAKRTSKDVVVGSQQAKLYADCIEKKWGVRPVIYYTNGYELMIVDGAGYPSRRVFGYYTKDELHSMIVRRGIRKITDTRINPTISDRPFIQEAATAVCENFNKKSRKSLIVMATGTGKTRCAISIVDVLQRAEWAKHVLFLADRTELVNQAKNAFAKFLPNSPVCAISETAENDRDYNARVIISTYQTMLNFIEREKRAFGVGKFDLIILDECHRTVYNKYQAILRYFDSLVLGLTATPREKVDASTYELFDLPKGEPTFNYGYEKAVAEGFLVDYANFDSTPTLLKTGLCYDDLSDDEKKEYEETFSDDDGNFPKRIDKELFYKRITNTGTIDAVLQTLMNDGLKVQNGERIGKSIIFAYNHDHAKLIVERFNKLYGEKGDGFIKLVDYSVNYAHTIIEDFKTANKEPHIVVSVDMLDTGVDVPEVLNLVFFKKVFSLIKFWQMIGRGTRVCKELNVFSTCKEFFENADYTDDTKRVYSDKQGFYIFDCCENFPYFKKNPKGKDGKNSLNLTQRIFSLKLDLIYELQRLTHQENPEHKTYYDKLKAEAIARVKNFNRDLINVRHNLKYVDKYFAESSWEYIGVLDLKELKKQIVPLADATNDGETAKVFDLWIFNMELAELVGEQDYSKAIQVVTTVCSILLDMTTIPEVAKKKEYLKSVVKNEFWQDITISKLEELREQVRDLLRFLPRDVIESLRTDFSDKVELRRGEHLTPQFKNYKQRVIDYLDENFDLPVVHKIRNIIPLNSGDLRELERILWEELGTQSDYEHIACGESVAVFVRKIVGLDREAVNKLFAEYLAMYQFNKMQEEFLHYIVTFVLENGDIEPKNLITDEPFKYLEYTEIFDGNPEVVYTLINMLHSAIQVAA
ncbi:DEAD/DEAH box helicase family protein [Pumilibacter muris]|uniref:type I restriction endonuclease subunit R n=1 Tax=Pumilibacter muris TaxID=2941510 RepID=UPI00203B3093|nr:DEAD/DEAH box helicase family protein [Pumilibacter muris]